MAPKDSVRDPNKPKKQTLHYSGKKKIHSVKNIVIATVKKKRVSFLSQTYPGKTHYKKVAETENIFYPYHMTLLKDTSFQGYEPKVHKTVQPKKAAQERVDREGKSEQSQNIQGAGSSRTCYCGHQTISVCEGCVAQHKRWFF